ncbi:hypothetical protein FQN49_004125 [Arthroderma sp. PD_2]|nr:hypothetical protein FQN49_004125 [Arthroderma sp. PD_2]
MKLFTLSLLALSTLCYPSTSAAYKQIARRDISKSWDSIQARHLSPAYPQGGLRKRHPGSRILQKDASLDFVDHTGHLTTRSDEPVFVTTLNVRSQHPILLLEDLEVGIHDVTCSESEIKLSFVNLDFMEEASRELMNATEFVAVSSHFECNEDEQRAPHMVTKVTVDKENSCILLSRTDTLWEDAFHTIDVSFSRKRQGSIVRRSQKPNSIRRKNEIPTASPSTMTTAMQFPAAPTSGAGLSENAPSRINVSHKDKKLVPPELPGVSLLGLPEGITLSCKDCTVKGGVELSTGSFTLRGPDEEEHGLEAAAAFIDHGEVALDVSGLFSRIELELALDAGLDLLNFSVPMPSIPLTPFAIPGVVQFGAIFTPQVSVSVQLSQPMNFSYGVDISVPKDSSFNININSVGNSTLKGFESTTFTEVPFQSSHGITDLTFSIGFSPEILFGVASRSGAISGGAGVTFNVPKASVKVSQLDGVDEKCEKVAQAPGTEEDKNKEVDGFFDSLIGNFTNVVPKLDFSIVPFVELQIDLPNYSFVRHQETTATATEYSLPTACLAFDKSMNSYGPPSQVLSTEAADSTGTALPEDRKQSAAGRVSMGSGWISLFVLMVVAAMFSTM